MLRLALKPLLVLLVSLPFIALVLALQTAPSVESLPNLSAAELGEIEQILVEIAPESTTRVSQQQVQLDAYQLNLMLRYGLQLLELTPRWAGQIVLEPDVMRANLSIRLSGPLSALNLNIENELGSRDGKLVLQSVTLGDFVLPQPLINFATNRLNANLEAADIGYADLKEVLVSIEQTSISEHAFSFQVPWQPELMARIGSNAQQLFISDADRSRIIFYYRTIDDVVSTIPVDLRAVSLNTFLVPLFSAASEASADSGDPVAENRAALQALAVYVNDDQLAQLIGTEAAAETETAKFIEVRLLRRQDLAQHVVSIAAISASAGASLAQLLSTTKESYDARYRSGFSFSDLTANSVGVAMADFATRNPATAYEFQRRVIALQSETDYMPMVGNNRDGISEAEFSDQYRNTNSTEYEQRLEEIETMIRQRPLFNNLDQGF